jgi:hypothetical protein
MEEGKARINLTFENCYSGVEVSVTHLKFTVVPPSIFRHSPVTLPNLDVALWTTIWPMLITTGCLYTDSATTTLTIT